MRAAPRAAARVLALAWAGALPGCMFFTTKREGRELSDRVADLDRRAGAQQASLDEALRRVDERAAELQRVIDDATRVVTQNSANVGARVDRMQEEISRLEGEIAEVRVGLEQLRKEISDVRSQAGKPVAPAMPEDREALWTQAQKHAADGNREEARRALRLFLDRHAEDKRAGAARLMLGDLYQQEGQLQRAAAEYQKVIDNYPESDAADDAFLHNGRIMFKLKFCSDARVYLQEMQRRYPDTRLKADATRLLAEIDEARKDKKSGRCAN